MKSLSVIFNRWLTFVWQYSELLLWALQHIQHPLPENIAQTLACSIVMSRLDYCNSLLYGYARLCHQTFVSSTSSEQPCLYRHAVASSGAVNIPLILLLLLLLSYCNSLYNGISQANLNKIQRIQNTLARVVTNTSKFEHITPILKKLHWLPIKQHIDYKLCLLTYKTLQIQQPTYLYNSLSFPSHSLSTRSSDSSVLSIPYVRTSLGKRAFSVIAPRLWNSLPPDTRNSLSVSTFRSKLKTHLFKLAFPP